MGLPSAANSVTVRLVVPARATAVSELTGVVEQAGGVVTGLDVTASGHERVRVDVTLMTRDPEHADEIVEQMRACRGRRDRPGLGPHLPHAPRRQAPHRVQGADPQP